MTGYPTPKPAGKIAVKILTAAFDDIPVSSKSPLLLPDKYIRVSRVGGGLTSLITDSARILVEAWAATVPEAEQICCEAIAALQNAQGTSVTYDTDAEAFIRGFGNVDGPVDYADPDVPDKERWQFTGDLLVSTS